MENSKKNIERKVLDFFRESYLNENVSSGKAKVAKYVQPKVTKAQAEQIRAAAKRSQEPIPEPKERQQRKGVKLLPSRGVKSNEKVLRGGYARTPQGIAQRRATELEKSSRDLRIPMSQTLSYLKRAESIKSALKNKKSWGDDVEYVLNYLLDEGYVDSYEDGIHLIELMSANWLGEILIEGV